MVRGSGPDPAPLGSIPGGCAGLGAKYLDQVCDIGMLYCSFITLCHAPSLGSTREACGLSCRSVQAMQAASVTTFPSATGTRTRVARVRAEYPSQLDYGGWATSRPAHYINVLFLRCAACIVMKVQSNRP